MSIQLKIKNKYLAEEAKIIRNEERKIVNHLSHVERPEKYDRYSSYFWLREQREDIRQHRIDVVRNEARATILARAFLKGMPYKAVERKRNPNKEYTFKYKIVPRVVDMVKKYCYYTLKNGKNRYDLRNITKEDILKWVEE